MLGRSSPGVVDMVESGKADIGFTMLHWRIGHLGRSPTWIIADRLDSGDILLVPSGVAHSLHDGSGAPPGPASSRPGLKMVFSENAGSGGRALLNALSAALFALTLRLASTDDAAPAGLLALAAHPRLSPALTAMFEDPAHSWTLPELSRLCNMSRATFARYFQRNLGHSAADLLLDIRMILAGNELKKPSSSVASVAETVGYQSEAAFQRVFKQKMGITPAQWRRASASKRTSRSSRT